MERRRSISRRAGRDDCWKKGENETQGERASERARRSQAPRFIGLLPILSRAQNAAKHGETVCERIYTAVSRITRRYRHGKQPPVIYQLNLSCHASNKGIRTIRCCLLSSLPIRLNLSLSLSLSFLSFSLYLSISILFASSDSCARATADEKSVSCHPQPLRRGEPAARHLRGGSRLISVRLSAQNYR